jgi:hypothetical protein
VRHKILKYLVPVIFFALIGLYIARFGGPAILRVYIQFGTAGIKKLAIFSCAPEEEITPPSINKKYLEELNLYRLRELEVRLPKTMKVVEGTISKTYYKKRSWRRDGSVAYLLCERPGFFVNLFPELNKQGVTDDYLFLSRTMNAKTEEIKTLSDAFFVVMKSIFTPDLGDQQNLKMVKFSWEGKRGFINYNLGSKESYYDCNLIDSEGNFLKLCIKDKSALLDLDKVLAIISSIKKISNVK